MSDFITRVNQIRKMRPGQRAFYTEDWNSMVDAVKALAKQGQSASSGSLIVDESGVHSRSPLTKTESFFGQITETGPADEDNYGDWRYWVQEVYESDTFDITLPFKVDENEPFIVRENGRWITAVNLAESGELFAGTINGQTAPADEYNIGFHGIANDRFPNDSASTDHGVKSTGYTSANHTYEHFGYKRIVEVKRRSGLYYFDTSAQYHYPHYYLQVTGVDENGCPCEWRWQTRIGQAVIENGGLNLDRPLFMNSGC